eukprot:3743012-Heterocapsa_arctica.AAC.1
MAQTPLGLMAPPKGQPSAGGGGKGAAATAGECHLCHGNGHKGAQCPNHAAKKDTAFMAKPEPARNRGCNVCKGKGHWKHHHQEGSGTQQRQTKGEEGGKEACRNWETYGRCQRPPDKPCIFKHDPAKKGPTAEGKEKIERMKNSPCNLWAKGNCSRGKHCLFKHDPNKKGSTQRQATTEDGDGGASGEATG